MNLQRLAQHGQCLVNRRSEAGNIGLGAQRHELLTFLPDKRGETKRITHAERAETDLDTARAETQRLTEQLDQAAADTGQQPQPADSPPPRTRRATVSTTSRTKKT
jgi:hypothetical protein